MTGITAYRDLAFHSLPRPRPSQPTATSPFTAYRDLALPGANINKTQRTQILLRSLSRTFLHFLQVGSVRAESSLSKIGQAYFEVVFKRKNFTKGAVHPSDGWDVCQTAKKNF